MFHHIDELIDSIIVRTAHKTDLSRITDFLNQHNNPQNNLRCIHVAGTNGKGSTTNYIRSMLQASGYKVGTFTSPHLEKHQDRIRINDVCIDDETFLRYGNTYDEQWQKHGLNMFEIDFFVSLLYFKEHNVDFVVYEVGMGGRLDCTNVITPLVSVITNIGMDHMQYLGDTYEKIAKEKAGIIKPGILLVTSETKDDCLNVFRKVCDSNNTSMIAIPWRNEDSLLPLTFSYRHYKQLQLGNVALYQVGNASLAIEVMHQLHEMGVISLSEESIRIGLQTIWRGRFEQMWDRPLTYIDGAHNAEGIRALCDTIKHFPQKKSVIFCAMRDKPIYPMLRELLEVSDDITLTQFDFPRIFPIAEFDGTLPIQCNASFTEAIDAALMKKDNMVIVTGSLYFITEARDYLIKKRGDYNVADK